MSGICGILRLDGAPAEGLEPMTGLLRRRGPDAARGWRDGPVALGHALLATTPEALHEELPLRHPETGCVVTADARLDNREELLAALGLSAAGRVVGDGELILRAYLAWGEDCPGRLLGDFAFAIWDPRKRRLLAARDQMGMRRLAYAHRPGRLLAFATEPRAVLAAPEVPPDLDEGRVADFLEGSTYEPDWESTMYRAVRRLPPAHLLLAEAGGVTVRRYWSLEPDEPLRLGSDDAYAEAFLEVFTEAVRSRLRNAGGLGSMLSGGMDSGSVVAVATRLLAAEGKGPLPTVSVVGPDPVNQAEAAAIRANLTLPGLDPHIADIGDPAAWLADLQAVLREVEEPFDARMSIQLLAYLEARRAGLRVVLDGLSGDVALHEGHQTAHLIRSGRLLDLRRQMRASRRFWGSGNAGPPSIRGAVRQVLLPVWPGWVRDLSSRRRRRKDMEARWPLLSPGFVPPADRAEWIERRRRNNVVLPLPPPHDRVAYLASLDLLRGRELHDRLAGFHGIEPRDPFLDLRVLRFVLRCPTEQMSWNGWPKVILRHAMKGLLPDEVIWRTGRTHFGLSLGEVLRNSPGLIPPEGPDLPAASEAFLRQASGLTYRQVIEKNLTKELEWSFLILALWLRGQAGMGRDRPT